MARLIVDCKCTLGEGILWCGARHALLWTDIQNATLWMHRPGDGAVRKWSLPDRLGCFALCESGRLLLGLAKGLFYADPDSAAEEPLQVSLIAAVEPHVQFTRINDGRADREGNFVFGTMNEHEDAAPLGSLYQYSVRHGLRRLDLGGVAIANSICFSHDGRRMYFCDSPTGRIMQCDYDAAGAAVANVREFAVLEAHEGLPDGSVIDADGCLWNAAWGAGVVRRYTPDGRVDREIAVPARNPTCPAFGGDALDDLYITSSRQEMTEEELDGTPHAGGVYGVMPGAHGLPESVFRDADR
jgi:sugar lactone lactonase YvrE